MYQASHGLSAIAELLVRLRDKKYTLAHKFDIWNLLYFSWFLATINSYIYLFIYLDLIFVQVADLSHENFKSCREVVT